MNRDWWREDGCGYPPLARWCLRFAVFCFASVLCAQTSSTQSQFWPEGDTYVALNGFSRLFFNYIGTRTSDPETYDNGLVGGHYDFYFLRFVRGRTRAHPDVSRVRVLMFRAGYDFSQTPAGNPKPYTKHIPTFEATARAHLPWEMLLADRNRGDLTIENGVFKPVYRNRLRLERPIKTGKHELSPYADAEAFYEYQYDAFARFRFSAGVEWSLNRHFVLQPYYLRERDTRPSPGNLNVLGLILQVYIR
jgi:hypothetical protein